MEKKENQVILGKIAKNQVKLDKMAIKLGKIARNQVKLGRKERKLDKRTRTLG